MRKFPGNKTVGSCCDIRLLYVSNALNHHQYPLARKLAEILGETNYRYAELRPLARERVQLGWTIESAGVPWLIKVHEGIEGRRAYDYWADTADVVVMGEVDSAVMARRSESGKLTFYMSERWWKPSLLSGGFGFLNGFLRRIRGRHVGMVRLLSPSFARKAARLRDYSRTESMHYLAIGKWAADDMRCLGAFQGKMHAWGYFPETDGGPPQVRQNKVPSIMWAGRMLDWKRVDVLLRAAGILSGINKKFIITIYGIGPQKVQLSELVRAYGLADRVRMLPTAKPAEIVKEMGQSDIYVLPSSGAEGWGAVINEAMSKGCVVVACDDAGASIMIEDGKNGFLFPEGDAPRLASILGKILEDTELRRRIGFAAWDTIASEWNPCTAATRLVALSEALLSGRDLPLYITGPCCSVG